VRYLEDRGPAAGARVQSQNGVAQVADWASVELSGAANRRAAAAARTRRVQPSKALGLGREGWSPIAVSVLESVRCRALA
jgi:hypothetical protein